MLPTVSPYCLFTALNIVIVVIWANKMMMVICNLGVSIRFSKPSHVFYGGHVVGESAMHFLEDIGSEVIHGYEVCNTRLITAYASYACSFRCLINKVLFSSMG